MLNRYFNKTYLNLELTIRSIWNFCNNYLPERVFPMHALLHGLKTLQWWSWVRTLFHIAFSFALSSSIIFGIFIYFKINNADFIFSISNEIKLVETWILLNGLEFSFYFVLFNLYCFSLFYYLRPTFILIFNFFLGNLVNKIFIIIFHYYSSSEILYYSNYFSIYQSLSSEQIYFHIFRTFDFMNISKEFYADIGLFLLNNYQEFASFYRSGTLPGNSIIQEIISVKIENLSQIIENSNLSTITIDEQVSFLYYALVVARMLACAFFILIPLLSNNVPTSYPYAFNPIEVNNVIDRFALAANHIAPIPVQVHRPTFIHKVNIYQQTDSIILPFDLQVPRNVGSFNIYTNMWQFFGTQKLSTLLSHYTWAQPHDLRAIVGNVRLSPNDKIIFDAYLNYIENLTVLPNNFQNYVQILQQGLNVIQGRIINRSFPINPILYPESQNFRVYNDIFVQYKPIKNLFGENVDLTNMYQYDYYSFL